MARTFKIAGEDITYPGNVDEYNELKVRLDNKERKMIEKFLDKYDALENVEGILNSGIDYGVSCLNETFLSFGDIFIARGVYNFDIHLLTNHRQYKRVIAPYSDAVDTFAEKYTEIVEGQESEKERRYVRKESRGRVIGGGFGVGGAVKGMAIAGALNMGTGLVHGAWNLVGNAMTDFAASDEKKKLYEDGRSKLGAGLNVSMDFLLDVISNLLDLDREIDFNYGKSKAIMDNINNGRITGDMLLPAYRNVFLSYPYEEDFYCKFIETFPQFEKDILVIADYFHVDLEYFLKMIHEVNGFYFADVALAQRIRTEYKDFAKEINKGFKENIAYAAHNTDYLVKNNEPAYVFFLLQHYRGLWQANKNNEVVTKYYEYLILKFKEIQSNIAQTHGPVKEQYSDIEINLAKVRMQIHNIKIFIGTDHVPTNDREAVIANSVGAIAPDSIFYLMIDGDAQLVLCSEGLINVNGSGARCTILSLDEALNFSASAEAGMFECDLKINGENFYSSSEVTEDEMKLVASALQVLFPIVAFTQKQHKLATAPEVADITFMGRCYEQGCGTKPDEELALKYYARAALYNENEAQYILAQKYQDGKGVMVNYGKGKFWLYTAARAGNQNALIDIMENRKHINERPFTDINRATSGKEFEKALEEMNKNGFGLSALEADLTKLEAINQFSILERIINVLQKTRGKITTSNYYCAPEIPEKKLNNVLNSYGCGINLTPEEILLLFDPTTFGGAKEGFIFTTAGILTDQRVYVKFDNIRDLQYQDGQFYVLLKNMTAYSNLYATTTGDEQSKVLFTELHKLYESLEGSNINE